VRACAAALSLTHVGADLPASARTMQRQAVPDKLSRMIQHLHPPLAIKLARACTHRAHSHAAHACSATSSAPSMPIHRSRAHRRAPHVCRRVYIAASLRTTAAGVQVHLQPRPGALRGLHGARLQQGLEAVGVRARRACVGRPPRHAVAHRGGSPADLHRRGRRWPAGQHTVRRRAAARRVRGPVPAVRRRRDAARPPPQLPADVPRVQGACQGYDADGVAKAPVYLDIGNAGRKLSTDVKPPTPTVRCACLRVLPRMHRRMPNAPVRCRSVAHAAKVRFSKRV
jgi:hypothetical protein